MHASTPRSYLAKHPSSRSGWIVSGLMATLCMLPGIASAIPFNAAITISGTAEFDSLGVPQAPVGNATQSGTLTRIAGGATSMTTLTNATILGMDPLSGMLSDLGDGFGIQLASSGSSTGPEASARNLFGDLSINLNNTSATDMFSVKLRIDFSGATAASGADAFGAADFQLLDGLAVQRFFSQVATDTLNGDRKFVFPNPVDIALTTGVSQTDAGSYLLELILNPGTGVVLGSAGAELRIDGGTFAAGTFSTELSTLISVESVTNLTRPGTPVPAPATLMLLLPGLLGIRMARHIRKSN